MRAAEGTAASPTAIQSGDQLGSLVAIGYGATTYSTSAAYLTFNATQNWTDSAQGTNLIFGTTANGSASASERMRIDQNGSVGIGTTTMNYLLDVRTATNVSQMHLSGTNIDEGGYLMGFSTNNLYLSGGGAYNGTNWIAKDTSASIIGAAGGAVVFYTNASLTKGSSFGAAERMRIDSSGNVGIGTNAPNDTLDVNGGLHVEGAVFPNAGIGLELGYNSPTAFIQSYNRNGSAWINMLLEGLAVTITNASDVRLKTNIHDLPSALGLEGIARLRPVTYHWLDRDQDRQNGEQIGLVAQEVEPVFPYLVITSDKNIEITLPDGTKKRVDHSKTLNYNGLVVPLVQAVKELKAENETLSAEHTADSKAIDDLRREVAELRQQMRH
jgi:hypothetical protein